MDRKIRWLVIAVIGSVLLIACKGGDGDDTGHGGPTVGEDLVSEAGQTTAREQLEKAHCGGHGAGCGDCKVKKKEQCDDGNTSAGDGCDATCHIEAGYSCSGEPSACATLCGDGLVVGAEACDDGNTSDSDGCDGACHIETGYGCSGAPSICATLCGDGLVLAGEGCDDGNTSAGDGCDGACHIETGYSCSGAPSTCATLCGDGIAAGAEGCDDGNTSGGDGCDATCLVETGYSCSGAPSACAVLCGDGLILAPEACDDGNTSGGDGCDAACHIETGYSCSGAPSTCTSGCGDAAVAGAEGCDDGNTKDGDGCSRVCQIEPGFSCSGATSLCCIPEVEPNDDAASSSGPLPQDVFGCGGIDFGNADYFSFTLPTTGDLVISTYNGVGNNYECSGGSEFPKGVDTVIYLYGPDGQTLIASNDNNSLLNAELAGLNFSRCSTISPATSPSARALPPGTYHVKVERKGNTNIIDKYTIKIHAIICGDGVIEGSEQCDGGPSCDASCIAVTPAPGESRQTAEPFPGCPTTPGSTARLGAPSCFPASGPIQWYSHVATDQVLAVAAGAKGAVALFNATGQEIRCSMDATQSPVATFSQAGQTFYVAVSLPSSVTCLDFKDHPYTGLQGTLTDLNVTFSGGIVGTRYSMAVSPTTIFVQTTSRVYEAPKTGNSTAILHASAQGITFANIGQDIKFANGSLFSLASPNSTAAPTTARLYRLFDGLTWGPTVTATLWETSPAYPTTFSSMPAFAFDGSNFIAVMGGNSQSNPLVNPVRLYSYSAAAPGQAQQMAAISPWTLFIANGIVADSKYLYVAGNGASGPGVGPQKEGVYRFDRANLSGPPVQIASHTGITGSVLHVSMALDDIANPGFLYMRDRNGNIHVTIDPAGSAEYAGVISTRGVLADLGMTYDPLDHVIYFVETESDPAGRLVKLQ